MALFELTIITFCGFHKILCLINTSTSLSLLLSPSFLFYIIIRGSNNATTIGNTNVGLKVAQLVS